MNKNSIMLKTGIKLTHNLISHLLLMFKTKNKRRLIIYLRKLIVLIAKAQIEVNKKVYRIRKRRNYLRNKVLTLCLIKTRII